MNSTMRSTVFALSTLLVLGVNAGASAQQASMTFFVTSAGSGKGADLGGLAGADRQCQQLAQAAGAGSHTWHAYLSAQTADGQPAVNARDRIGKGPWQNAKGVVVAKDLDEYDGALGVLPGALTDAVAGVDCGLAVRRLGAEIG